MRCRNNPSVDYQDSVQHLIHFPVQISKLGYCCFQTVPIIFSGAEKQCLTQKNNQ